MTDKTEMQGNISSRPEHQYGLFWTVTFLSLPSVIGLLILLSTLLHPNVLAYALLPLMPIAPAALLLAVIFTLMQFLRVHRTYKRHWTVIAVAALSEVIAVGIIYLHK